MTIDHIGVVVSNYEASKQFYTIDVLFVDENHRGKELGSQLLKFVENEALSLGAYLSHLDTFDFQAKDFYLKQGYEIYGTLENCPPNHDRYYLKKNLK